MTFPALSSRIRLFLVSLQLLAFSSLAAPVISSFSPNSGPPGTQVTIRGSGFRPSLNNAPVVYFGNSITPAHLTSANQNVIQCVVPDTATTGPVTVFVQGSGQFTTQAFFFLPPRIRDFGTKILGSTELGLVFEKPVVATQGGTLTIEGANFFVPNSPQLVVRVGDVQLAATATSASQIQATLPPLLLTGHVSVFTAVGGTTNLTDYVYGPPRISRFTSNGVSGSTIELVGFNFLTRLPSQLDIRLGGVRATNLTVLSNTNLQLVVPDTAISGPISLSVPGGTFITSSNFVVRPSISGFTPVAGPPGTVVTLNGSGLNGTTQVRFGNIIATLVTNVSPLQVTAVVPPGVANGTISLTTTNGSATTTTLFYQAPRVDTFTPSSGSPGTLVTVNGLNLSGAVQVQLNNVLVPGVAQVNNQQLTFQVPANATSGRIRVTSPGGSAESAASFTVQVPGPVISGFTPTFGAPGTTVTISGINLTTATRVSFNAVTANFTVQGNSLVATVPANATTGRIQVATPQGIAESTANFTVGTSADLRILFGANLNPAVAYAPLLYNIQVQNTGPLPAANTVIEFEIPDGMSLIETIGTLQPEIAGQKLTYNRGQLDAGASFFAGVRVNAGAPATTVARGKVTANTPDSNPGDNSREVPITVALPRLRVEYDAETGILLSWPSAAGNLYRLNQAGTLTNSFDPVPGTPDDDGSRFLMIRPANQPHQYFRLELVGP
jgi:hypothetical protein